MARFLRGDNSSPAILRGANFMHPLEHHGDMTTFTAGIAKLRSEWGGNIAAHGYSTRAVMNNTAHPYSGTQYLALVDEVVALAKDAGCYTLLRPRWGGIEGRMTDGGAPTNTQFVGIPPQEAIDSLGKLALRYKNEPSVLFATQVEPNGSITWAQYVTYANACVAAVRAQGNLTPVGVPGLDFGRNIDGARTNPVAGSNVFYISHPYGPSSSFQSWFGAAVDAGLPVLIGEMGTPFSEGGVTMTQGDVDALLAYCDSKGVPWLGWAFEADQNPSLVSSDVTLAPKDAYGASVQAKMRYTPANVGDALRTTPLVPPAVPTSNVISNGTPLAATSTKEGDVTTLALGESNATTRWRSNGYPATVTDDLSSRDAAARKSMLIAFQSEEYPGDIAIQTAANAGTAEPAYNRPGAWTIEGHVSSGAQASGWVALKTVTGNQLRAWSSLIGDGSTAYAQVRARFTAGHPNNTAGNQDVVLGLWQIADVSAGNNSSHLFWGDSITSQSMMLGVASGFLDLWKTVRTDVAPVIQALGSANLRADQFATAGTLRNLWLADLAASAMRYVVLAIGTNDNTNGTSAQATAFKAAYNTLIQDVLAAGKIPVIPTIGWTSLYDVSLANIKLAELRTQYGSQVRAGADIYTLFQQTPTLVTGNDGLHPTTEGARRWRLAMAQNLAAL